MMTTVMRETKIPRTWISCVASEMFYALMIINIYYLSKEMHTSKGFASTMSVPSS
jgi:hypothetical protein